MTKLVKIQRGRESHYVKRSHIHRDIDVAYNLALKSGRRITAVGVFIVSRSRSNTGTMTNSCWGRDGSLDAIAGSKTLTDYISDEIERIHGKESR